MEAPATGLQNETLNGVFGALINRTADIGITPVGISWTRAQHFVMLDSQISRRYMVIVHAAQLISTEDSEFVRLAVGKLMSTKVLCGVVATLIGLALVGTGVDLVQARIRGQSSSLVHLCSTWLLKMIGMGLGLQGFGEKLWCDVKESVFVIDVQIRKFRGNCDSHLLLSSAEATCCAC